VGYPHPGFAPAQSPPAPASPAAAPDYPHSGFAPVWSSSEPEQHGFFGMPQAGPSDHATSVPVHPAWQRWPSSEVAPRIGPTDGGTFLAAEPEEEASAEEPDATPAAQPDATPAAQPTGGFTPGRASVVGQAGGSGQARVASATNSIGGTADRADSPWSLAAGSGVTSDSTEPKTATWGRPVPVAGSSRTHWAGQRTRYSELLSPVRPAAPGTVSQSAGAHPPAPAEPAAYEEDVVTEPNVEWEAGRSEVTPSGGDQGPAFDSYQSVEVGDDLPALAQATVASQAAAAAGEAAAAVQMVNSALQAGEAQAAAEDGAAIQAAYRAAVEAAEEPVRVPRPPATDHSFGVQDDNSFMPQQRPESEPHPARAVGFSSNTNGRNGSVRFAGDTSSRATGLSDAVPAGATQLRRFGEPSRYSEPDQIRYAEPEPEPDRLRRAEPEPDRLRHAEPEPSRHFDPEPETEAGTDQPTTFGGRSRGMSWRDDSGDIARPDPAPRFGARPPEFGRGDPDFATGGFGGTGARNSESAFGGRSGTNELGQPIDPERFANSTEPDSYDPYRRPTGSAAPASAPPVAGRPVSAPPAGMRPASAPPANYTSPAASPTSAPPAGVRPASAPPASVGPASAPPAGVRPASALPTSALPTSALPTSVRPASGPPASVGPASGPPASVRPASGPPASGIPLPPLPASGNAFPLPPVAGNARQPGSSSAMPDAGPASAPPTGFRSRPGHPYGSAPYPVSDAGAPTYGGLAPIPAVVPVSGPRGDLRPPLPQRIPAAPDVPDVPDDEGSDFIDTARGPSPLDPPELARIATHLRYDEGFEEQDAPRPDGFDMDAVLAAVRQVDGVRDAHMKPNPGGVHTLRLDLADGANSGQVSRDVARLLKERMGLAAEPRRGSRTPSTGRDLATRDSPSSGLPSLPRPMPITEQLPSPPTSLSSAGGHLVERRRHPVTAVRGRVGQDGRIENETEVRRAVPRPGASHRIVLDQVQVSTLGLDATVEVRLTNSGSPAIGVASGPAVDGYILRLSAVAAVAAVDQLLATVDSWEQPGRCFVEHAAVVPFGGCEVAIVVVLLVGGGNVEQLAGSALVTGDPRQAIVRATLAAVNRRLDALLS
jgi:hypothetical protein